MSTTAMYELGPKERFFRYFQLEVAALQEQMDKIADFSLVGGERADATDHCLAGIARLANEVKDASQYLPAYDQRTYSETIKALSERFQETRATFQPRARFSFRATRKNPPAISLGDAAEIASVQRLQAPSYQSGSSSAQTPSVTIPSTVPSSNEPRDSGDLSDSDHLIPQNVAIRKPSLSESTTVQISNLIDVHIILPSSASAATPSGLLTNLNRCVVDMSVSTATGKPFAGLALKNIRDSLIVCGHVDGPIHITGIENSAIVVACRQFRMHDCKEVDVYLLCASRPIIEDCSDIRFSPLPESYMLKSEQPIENQWDKVDDFKWLKAEHSPNWGILPPEKRITLRVWRDVVPGGAGIALGDILKETIRPKQ
ncbi:MAG: hypothetical protein M1839_008617 [Geoglossum umbratile]|nr:MAG: hypothetical protein M1839_008617 [Geoglossum umbratile]